MLYICLWLVYTHTQTNMEKIATLGLQYANVFVLLYIGIVLTLTFVFYRQTPQVLLLCA